MVTGFSIVSALCLAQNYTQSLIPEANDGIEISNRIAYWIIGDDGWSTDRFKKSFDQSIYFTLFLIVVCPFIVLIESKVTKRSS
ncbi:hypothetical protein SD71_15435 [Cohnella kolymensis]|uniref:VanZ-like domain-containing protein n=1 Tax=Cohnella kolymensis TaxID=1590652 RepID=A0ABR5A2C5_9BACL|nr:hypothetical protein SD71_15435 [Cohnella kolymensis]